MKFDWIAGTGGIGKGEVFKLTGNDTLGREESRSAVLTDYKDYCKAHIILSYVSRLTDLPVYAIGSVGFDARGGVLLREMNSVGINVEFVKRSELPTKYSVCFLYENGDGGNITSCNDACAEVTADYLCESLERIIERHGRNGLLLAAPEVELKDRMEMLSYAKKRGVTTAASVLACEAEEFVANGYVKYCDILSVNADEIKAIGGGSKARGIEIIEKNNADISLIVTSGKNGAVLFSAGKSEIIPAVKADAVSTAGAGDALLGGVLAGIAAGENFETAVKIGSVCASFAVESRHTIPEEFNNELFLRRYKNENNGD